MNKNVISADDPQALEKLRARLEKLEEAQKEMRAVNAYYRKNGTLDGCPGLPPAEIDRLKAKMARSWHREDKPYCPMNPPAAAPRFAVTRNVSPSWPARRNRAISVGRSTAVRSRPTGRRTACKSHSTPGRTRN